MRFKILLLLLFFSVVLKAQQPYRNLIFSEVRMDQYHHSYVELCNMGNVAVDLARFDVGSVSPWSYAPWDTVNTFSRTNDAFVPLPARMLNPGETFVIATVRDWGREMHLVDPEKYNPTTKDDTWLLADMEIHASESPGGAARTDSISDWQNALVCWAGTYCFYICDHFAEGDSAITDAVNGIFTNNGQRPGNQGASDVAGVPSATSNSILVRKHTVTTGNIDWEKARGVDITDSEWLPVPILVAGGFEAGRKEFWTVGNHGNYRINAQNLKSKTIAIDWNSNTMTVNWGARRQDSIMNEFDRAPGIAWKYKATALKIDSAFNSVRTGDSITLYGCGDQMDIVKFNLIALAPTASENRVIPKNAKAGGGNWYTPFVVSAGVPGMDTISEVPYATRVDTLFKYLEKPDAATWKIVWADGTERPDLIKGDILRVTAQNGTAVKDYYINVLKYRPSHNANLASITWPDIPEFYKGIYGWVGDTIPNFSPTKYNYTVQVPFETKGIPGLIAKPEDVDTRIVVERATSLFGSDAAKTVKFHTTAEDDTTSLTYSVRLEKEKDLSNVQPYEAEPFFSQFVFRADYRQTMIEICNPGNKQLDLSRYVIVRSNSMNTSSAITTSSTDADWANRFRRYVPGYIWEDEAEWQVQPGILKPDLGVNPIVEGGDVFVMAWAFPNFKDATAELYPGVPDQIDVNFKNGYNPWGIELAEDAGGLANYSSICGGWFNDDWILYKIINDSVLNGTKPLIDPYDVQVIDVIGRCNGQGPGLMIETPVTNFEQNSGMKRLPQYYKGNPEPAGSFLDTLNNKPSEWAYTTEAYWTKAGYGWPIVRAMSSDGIGSHEFNPITEFISTVASASYTVSKGYSKSETIGGGVQAGITVADFMQRIITIEGQTITLTSNGTLLTDSDILPNGTLLKVVSPNGENESWYTISVAAQGLDTNALLTSTKYQISVTGETGKVEGFDSGTTLREVFDNVTAPANASLFGAFKADGSYAPFVQMKFDSTYVDVIATDKIFFEVIAQDGVTRITYQLIPNSQLSDAYVLSTVYNIDQDAAMIKLVPDGSSVASLFSNLTPAPGATIVLENNMGQVREMGSIYDDDKLIVTAQDGVTTKVYSLEFYSDFAERYNAYLFSELYKVNQTTKKINGVLPTTSVDEFFENLTFSLGATSKLVDATGAEVTSGSMTDGLKITVTSNNGLVNRTYAIIIDRTDVVSFGNSLVKVYPNPTTGTICFDGLKAGNSIRVFNVMGKKVLSLTAVSEIERASIEDQPAGLYMVIVNDGSNQVAQFKMIKK